MREHEIEALEVDLLLSAVHGRYGYDFGGYARASIERRVRQFCTTEDVPHVASLIPLLLRDPELAGRLIRYFSVSVTEMFRDPHVYLAIRREVAPLLRTYPHVKVWLAGCATGEEVYSMAILLAEEGLADRCTVFGTDLNEEALEHARQGIYPVSRIRDYTRNYQRSGPRASFSEYYHARYDSAVMDGSLKRRLTFAQHNLATDEVFGEMHLILCRNVLIYFGKDLQARALRLFTDSLVRGGFLCLGTREDLRFSEVDDEYEVVDEKARIYKKRAT
jgi:chemotaxis protein methyltransferase CheR